MKYKLVSKPVSKLRCRWWYSERAKENLRNGMFGRIYDCVDVAELKRYRCPECGWVSKYDEDGEIIKASEKEGTLEDEENLDDWHMKFQADMKIHMNRIMAEQKVRSMRSAY